MSNGAEAAASLEPPNHGDSVGDSYPFYTEQPGVGSGPNSGSFPSLSSGLLDEDPKLVNHDSKYECPVCILRKSEHKLLQDPVQTACGHRMCLTCVDLYLGDETSKKCPADDEDCEQVTRENIFPDPGFRREMKQLLVYCVHEGCTEQIRFSMLEKHVKECVYREVPCINSPRGCREQIKFKDVDAHLKQCGYRPVICEQCGSEFSFNSKQEHDLEQCPEALVSCTYLCGQEMKRRLLEDHKAVCLKKPAECQFKILGCTFTGNSEDVRKHEQDVASHFQVLLECFTTFRLQSLEMQKTIEV